MIAQKSLFRKLWEQGYTRLVPIVPPTAELSPKSSLSKRPQARGKAVGIRGEDGLWRGFDWLKHTTTEDDLTAWDAMGAGVGIRLGAGLVAVDIDTADTELAELCHKTARDVLGVAACRVGNAPKRLLVYRVSGGAPPYQRVDFAGKGGKTERVELLSEGRQFVAYGTHPVTGKPYHWTTNNGALWSYSMLDIVSPEQIDAFFRELARVLPKASQPEKEGSTDRNAVPQHQLTGDPETVSKAVSALPNTDALFPTYDDYIRIGAAIKAATQDDPELGKELFLQWSGRWDGGETDPDAALADFGRIKPPYGIGAQYLYDLAARYNPQGFDIARVWFTELPIETAATQTAPTPDKFKLVHIKEAAESALTTAAKPLIKGLLDQGAMTVLYGESNAGKTFVAMDIAFHVAAGLAWGGLRTTQAPVIYIAAEGGAGARKRAAALRAKYGDTLDAAPFHFILAPVDFLRAEGDVAPFCQLASTVGPGLVVVDTLSRALAGGDENSSTDMGALVKNLDAIRNATSAHLMVIHHSGKDRAKGARGHSLLRAATDTEIEVADKQISVTKQRDLDGNFLSCFELDIRDIGLDADGEMVTSCTVKLVKEAAAVVGVATPREKDVLEAVDALSAVTGNPAVAVGEIIAYFGEGSNTPMKKNTVNNHLARLVTKGLIVQSGRGKYQKSASEVHSVLHQKAGAAILSDSESHKSTQLSTHSIFD